MHAKNLCIEGFRNISRQENTLSERLNILIGENGQGKTNFIEAIYFLLNGTTFRFGEDHELVQFGKRQSLLKACFKDQDLEFEFSAEITDSKKKLVVNGKPSHWSKFPSKISCIQFSPESLNSIKGSAESRRALVDESVSQSESSSRKTYLEFTKALKTRNRILRDFVKGVASKTSTMDMLEAIDPSYIRLCARVCEYRLHFLNCIQSEVSRAFDRISTNVGAGVGIEISYKISSEDAMDFNIGQIQSMIGERLNELRPIELVKGTSLVGPQKHEISFLYNRKDSRIFCSQGQQRAIILAFKMAQVVYHRKVHGTYPLLMLDDVLSELDEPKKTALIAFLQEIQTQIFITSTDVNLPKSFRWIESSVLRVTEGKVKNLLLDF